MSTSQTKIIKVGVVGVGHLGRHHARNLSSLKGVKLVGIFDTDKAKAQEIAKIYHTNSFESLEQLLSHTDAVTVVTPTKTHYQVAEQALRAGCDVLVEKPITATLKEADGLIHIAEKFGRILQVGHIERFNGAIQAIQDLIDQPLFIECHRLAPYNPRGTDVPVILDLAIHDLDIVLGFVHSPIRAIGAVGAPIISKSADIGNIRIEFENGCVANITVSRVSAKATRKIRFFQKNCYFSVDLLNKTVDVFRKKVDIDLLTRTDKSGYTEVINDGSGGSLLEKIVDYQRIIADQTEPLRAELASFIECIQMNRTPLVSGREGRRALSAAYRIIKIIRENPIFS